MMHFFIFCRRNYLVTLVVLLKDVPHENFFSFFSKINDDCLVKSAVGVKLAPRTIIQFRESMHGASIRLLNIHPVEQLKIVFKMHPQYK